MSKCEWIFIQSCSGPIPLPWVAWGRPFLSGISSFRSAEVLHGRFLWNRQPGGLHVDIHADRRPVRWLQLHRGLLRGPTHAALHHKRNLPQDPEFTLTPSGKGEKQIHQTVLIWQRKASWFFGHPPNIILLYTDTDSTSKNKGDSSSNVCGALEDWTESPGCVHRGP